MTDIQHHLPAEPEKIVSIDAEYLSGRRFDYQEDISLVQDIDLMAATPGKDLNWLEDVELLEEDGKPAVFDRYSNSFLKIYFPIPAGHEDEIARKVLIKHLQSGNSYGIALKERHCKFPQPELGPWVQGRRPSAPTGSPACSRAGSRRSIEMSDQHLAAALAQARTSDHSQVRVRREARASLRRALALRGCGRNYDTNRIPEEEYASFRRNRVHDRILPSIVFAVVAVVALAFVLTGRPFAAIVIVPLVGFIWGTWVRPKRRRRQYKAIAERPRWQIRAD